MDAIIGGGPLGNFVLRQDQEKAMLAAAPVVVAFMRCAAMSSHRCAENGNEQ